jgi:uncharacterized protein YdaU (DUF1376 family)
VNRPWMPLYIADYRADTAHLSACEHGAYLLLIMHYWQTGGLPKADGPLSRIACMSPAEWKKAKPSVAPFFGEDWSSHKRIDAELAKASEISGKRRAAAEQRHSKTDANADANAQLMDTHAGAGLPLPSPTQSNSESLESFAPLGLVKKSGYSPPKHGAFHKQKGLVYVLETSEEWPAHSADYLEVHGKVPRADKGGGFWFKMKGEAAA